MKCGLRQGFIWSLSSLELLSDFVDYSLLNSSVHGFPWEECLFLVQSILWDLGMEPWSPALAAGFFTTEPTWKPMIEIDDYKTLKKNIPGL